MIWSTLVGFLAGWLSSSYRAVLGLLVFRVRIQPEVAATFYQNLESQPLKVLWSHQATVGTSAEAPPAFESKVVYVRGMVVWVNSNEELLRAGYSPKQHVVNVSCFRWNSKQLLQFCAEMCQQASTGPQVYFAKPWNVKHFGPLTPTPRNYIVPEAAHGLIRACTSLYRGDIDKTGAVLAGTPGNGKSSLIRYLCNEFGFDLIAFSMEDDMTNSDIYNCFQQLLTRDRPCVAVFEDFDTRYNGRESSKSDVKHSFDTFLNALDGPYLYHRQTVFILTTNHLDKVDPALTRPGRFDFLIELTPPGPDEIHKILPCATREDISKLAGLTAAEIAAFRNIDITDENIEKIRRTYQTGVA